MRINDQRINAGTILSYKPVGKNIEITFLAGEKLTLRFTSNEDRAISLISLDGAMAQLTRNATGGNMVHLRTENGVLRKVGGLNVPSA